MKWSADGLLAWVLAGAIAGQAGALVFGLAMLELGVLDSIASVVGFEDSLFISVPMHMIIASLAGAGLGAMIWSQRHGASETLLWGVSYGAGWWFLGPLTVRPLLEGRGLGWDVPAAQSGFESLLGHLVFGGTTALALVLIKRQWPERPSAGAAVRGLLAGTLAAAAIAVLLAEQDRLHEFSGLSDRASSTLAWVAALGAGAAMGLLYALLVPRPREGSGPGLLRGSMFAFVLWVIVLRSVVPLVAGDGLGWGLVDTREDFASLLGYLLFGGAMAVCYQLLAAVWRALFADEVFEDDDEGAGTRSLRALGRGAIAGVAGGIVFTYIMIEIGALENVSRLVGAESTFVGLAVHFSIAATWGASYGLLFRRQSFGPASAAGWGVSFAVFVWVLGPNTLMPILLGSVPEWTASGAASLTASFVGHVAYGAAIGLTFYHFEARFSPWWIPISEAEVTIAARRRELLLTSAPALWSLVAVVGLTLPILLGSTSDALEPLYRGR